MPPTNSTSTVLKVIATRNFRNTHPKSIVIEDPLHPDHVHKGAEFSLDSRADSDLIGLLNASGSIIDSEDEASVKRLQAEIAAEEKAEKASADAAKKAAEQNSAFLQQLAAMIRPPAPAK